MLTNHQVSLISVAISELRDQLIDLRDKNHRLLCEEAKKNIQKDIDDLLDLLDNQLPELRKQAK